MVILGGGIPDLGPDASEDVGVEGELVERGVFQAVLHGMEVEVLYASAHGKSRDWRRILPHALAWSGHRWHARAWCVRNGDYRDFVLGKIEEIKGPVPAPPVIPRDKDWETRVVVEVRPHRELEDGLQAAIAREFGMEKRRLRLSVRASMVQYLETALGLVPADGQPGPPKLERVKPDKPEE